MNQNKNLHSRTVLTEFARSQIEEELSLGRTSLSKIVNKIYDACNNSSVNQETEESDDKESEKTSSESSPTNISDEQIVEVKQLKNQDAVVEEYQVDPTLGRTPLNVVKRISNLLAMKDKDLNDYKNTELQKLWMPDSKSIDCYDCNLKFNTFRRKHHCRLCGQIFCSRCCSTLVPGKIIMVTGELRVCNYCSKVVLSYLKSADIAQDLKSDLQALEDDLSSKFVGSSSTSSNVLNNRSPHRKPSVGYQEERLVSNPVNALSNADRKSILQQSNSLKALYEEMIKTLLSSQNKTYNNSESKGSELMSFLITNQKFTNKQQALAVLNAFQNAGFIVPIIAYENSAEAVVGTEEDSFQVEFSENLLYKLSKIEEIDNMMSTIDDDPELENIIPPSINTERSLYANSSKDQELQSSILSTAGSKPLLESYCEHEENLLSQLLRNENLDASWSRILINQCARIAHTIHPEFGRILDSMDVRNFVNIKKLSGGTKNECTIVGGVVFTKNVAHKDMKTKIDNPKILLLQCPIAYQRVEGKFVTIESLILQEKEYLRNVTSRILSYAPDVILVHKNVAGIAQDLLRDKGITLILDVKLSVFERLSQCLQCDVVTSIDSNIGRPKLGTCKKFYTKSFIEENGSHKTLMFFDIPYSQRGCSLLLRGGSEIELAKVKKVANFLLFSRYNFRLELSYLLDVFAQPPAPKQSIFDSIDHQSPSESILKLPLGGVVQKEKSVNIQIGESVADFSDPLRAAAASPSNFEAENIELDVTVQHPFDNKFRTALSSTILSVSPALIFPLPYLETEAGKKCFLRSFFPSELFHSKQWLNASERNEKNEVVAAAVMHDNKVDTDNLNITHHFLTLKITETADSKVIQTAIADYRRTGGRFKKVTKMKKIEKKSEIAKLSSTGEAPVKDALDIYVHQHLPVLFCSFYYNTRELPTSFCAQPLLLSMHFYGQDDIMLGLFLERYCFRSSYICPSCKLPMMNHVRKYAHSMGVVTVKLAEDPIKNENSNIIMTSRCTVCNTMTPKVNISNDTWCLSFAKFLELKFHGHSYTRRNIEDDSVSSPCLHSIHRDHIQYFSSNGVIVSFSYSPVDVWKIKFPQMALQLKSPELIDKKNYGEKIKSFSVKGYEIYAKIHEKLANLSSDVESPMVARLKRVLHRDQLIFKCRVEVVYTLLSSSEVFANEINDAMLMMMKDLSDSIEIWGPRLSEAAVHAKNSQKNENLHREGEMFDELDDDELDMDLMTKSSDEVQTDNRREKFDKKTIKRLLSTLLPSSSDQNPLQSPFSPSDHFLPTGQFPILVHDQDVSSIIAYSLMSYDYKKFLEEVSMPSPDQNASSSSPSLKRRNQSDGSGGGDAADEKDGSSFKETSENKKNLSNHAEICVQDSTTQFTVKIYFAKEFDELRSKCLTLSKQQKSSSGGVEDNINNIHEDIRKSYARSLSHSQKWEARGGKSGSKFSKTCDDRFILKVISFLRSYSKELLLIHEFFYVGNVKARCRRV
jgi:1-phosphatidylinositol-3-phosphate 5-kinase